MTEIKHQHIVPACYLANWGINGNQGRKSEIYFFDVNNHQARVSSVNKLPTENYFYDIPELGEKKQLLENFFGVIEGEYAALLQKLLKRIEDRQNINSNKEPLLSTEDKNELTSQFAMQIVRTQAFRSGYEHVWTTLKESFPWANISDFTKGDIQAMHTDEIGSFRMARFYANLLNDRNLVFLINHSTSPLLTSDNPGIFINHSANLSEPMSPVSKDVTFYMPLSPKVAVEFYHKSILRFPEICIPLDFSRIVHGYNRRLRGECVRFMFSNKNDFSYLIGSEK